jgi:hypothetical protein
MRRLLAEASMLLWGAMDATLLLGVGAGCELQANKAAAARRKTLHPWLENVLVVAAGMGVSLPA